MQSNENQSQNHRCWKSEINPQLGGKTEQVGQHRCREGLMAFQVEAASLEPWTNAAISISYHIFSAKEFVDALIGSLKIWGLSNMPPGGWIDL